MQAEATSPQIVLAYRREGELSTGRIYVSNGSHLIEFQREEWVRMLTHLARTISAHPNLPVLLVREDVRGLRPFLMDTDTVELFRIDPVRAIQSMTPAPHAPISQPTTLPPRALRAGYDTLADAFGENTYFRLSRGGINCPGCGTWTMVRTHPDKNYGTFACKRCAGGLTSMHLHMPERWASISTAVLLLLPIPKFYLSLAWNPGIWITREELLNKCMAFVAEKENACSSPQRTVPAAS